MKTLILVMVALVAGFLWRHGYESTVIVAMVYWLLHLVAKKDKVDSMESKVDCIRNWEDRHNT